MSVWPVYEEKPGLPETPVAPYSPEEGRLRGPYTFDLVSRLPEGSEKRIQAEERASCAAAICMRCAANVELVNLGGEWWHKQVHPKPEWAPEGATDHVSYRECPASNIHRL